MELQTATPMKLASLYRSLSLLFAGLSSSLRAGPVVLGGSRASEHLLLTRTENTLAGYHDLRLDVAPALDPDVLLERHEGHPGLGEGVEDGHDLTQRAAEPRELADDQAVAALQDARQLVEPPALFGGLSGGGRLDEVVDADVMRPRVLQRDARVRAKFAGDSRRRPPAEPPAAAVRQLGRAAIYRARRRPVEPRRPPHPP